jgi:hypothetical protein
LVWEAEEKEQKPESAAAAAADPENAPRPPPAVKRDSHSFAFISSPVLIPIPLDVQTPLTSPPNQQKIKAFLMLAGGGVWLRAHPSNGIFYSHALFFHQLFAKRSAY